MIDVEELFVDRPRVTRVWTSQHAKDEVISFGRTEQPKQYFLRKLEEFAAAGFRNFVGKEKPIRLEWDEVFRIGSRRSLFRAIGFFNGLNEFIVIDAYLKKGQKLSASDRARIRCRRPG